MQDQSPPRSAARYFRDFDLNFEFLMMLGGAIVCIGYVAWTTGTGLGEWYEASVQFQAEQKKEAREGVTDDTLVDSLQKIYQMEVTRLSPADVEVFREKTKPVYDKWARNIGVEIVRSAEKLAENRKPN